MKISMDIIEERLYPHVTGVKKDAGYSGMVLDKWTLSGNAAGYGAENVTGSGRSNSVTLYVLDSTIPAIDTAFSVYAGTPVNEPRGSFICTDLSLPELTECINNIFHDFAALSEKLSLAAFYDHDPEALIYAMSPCFNNRLVLCSSDHKVIAESPGHGFFTASGIPLPSDNGFLPVELFSAISKASVHERGDAGYTDVRVRGKDSQIPVPAVQVPDPTADGTGIGASRTEKVYIIEPDCTLSKVMCVNTYFQGLPSLRLMYSFEPGNERSSEPALLACFGSYFEAFQESCDYEQALPRERLEEAALRLLSGEAVTSETLEMALQFRGWQINGPFMVSCILPSDSQDGNHTAAYYCRILGSELKDVFAFSHEGRILMIINLRRLKRGIREFMERSVEFLRDNHILAGFSNPFNDIKDLPFYWKQAGAALSEGLRLRPTIWYHHFSDYAVSYILNKAAEDIPARYLKAVELKTLLDYDLANGTEYYNTLKVFLEENMNTVQAAKKLFISRGTMIYRVGRISELTGLTLKDAKERFYLLMSFYM